MRTIYLFKYSLFLLLTVLLLGCGEEEKTENPPRPVKSMVVEAIKSYEERIVSGIIQPADTAELSFEVPGKVDEVYFELGERFQENDVLARLEQTNYELAVKEREGQLSETRARFLEAKRDYNRKADLVKDGAVSRAEYDLAKSEFESAKDQIKIAEARLGLAQEDLNDTVLSAPYEGTVAARHIEPSQRISPNEAAFVVQGEERLEVRMLVSESLLAKLEVGKQAQINVPALQENLEAKITEIGTAAEDANSFPVVLKMEREQIAGLKPGMSAEAIFQLDNSTFERQGHILPVSAFMADKNNGHYVYKIVEKPITVDETKGDVETSYIVLKTPVTVLNLFDQYGVVKGDLEHGELIVENGLAFIKDGQAVTLIEEGIALYNP